MTQFRNRKNGRVYPTNQPKKATPRYKEHKKLKEGEFYHGILNTKESHWGIGQTGVGLEANGNANVSTNKPTFQRKEHTILGKGGRYYPSHRSLDGYSAIYSFGYPDDWKHDGTIWLYPDAYKNIEKVKPALKSLKGKYGMTGETTVKSNTTRKELFQLKDL